MSNSIYKSAAQAFLNGTIDLDTDIIKITLIDTASYTVNLDTHANYSDVPGVARVAESTLTGVTIAGGVFDANDVVFGNLSGTHCEAVIIWKDTGTESTSGLIAYIDEGTGLPITPNGKNLTIEWDSGSSKIFALEETTLPTSSTAPLGSIDNPRLVTDAAELAEMATYPSECFELANDIDFTGVDWTPPLTFSGVLDGKGHVINNFTQGTFSGQFALISALAGGTIRCLGIKTVSGTGSASSYEGTFFGAESGYWLVEDCYAEGSINLGGDRGGGFYGLNQNSTGVLRRCWSAVSLSGSRSGAVCYNYSGATAVLNVYYDNSVSVGTTNGTSTSNTDMKKQATFVGWNFDNIWEIDEDNDYPRLRVW